MTHLEQIAEAKAKLYAKDMAAQEDYVAGYIAGAQRDRERLEFITKQLVYLINLGSQYDEFYCVSTAQYILEKIK